ncbi:MAG TPA: N-acetylglucosamine-6-phosphate deacetylase [Candidatus Angelobacter sp.]|nr:N-acetylglucosamine-6-phosphate deacetylase [Candidatus Angelobacter sp.]
MALIVTASQLFTPLESIASPFIVIEDGYVTSVGSQNEAAVPPGKILAFKDQVLAPAYLDIHLHGSGGHDVMEADDTALMAIESMLASRGVAAYLPTTVTAAEDRTLRALEHLGKAMRKGVQPGRTTPVGIHLEGPFISCAKRGVHPPEHLVAPSPEKLERYWEASGGTLRMLTIAPEIPGAIETIRHARQLGIRCSIGHSNATYEEATAGIAAGATHATHTFNAMRALDHRDPGILGAVLQHRELTADIIADGIHVHPSVVDLFIRAKGLDRAILITDAISATGMPEGRYDLGGLEVEVKDERCQYNGKLAGSVLTLERAIRNVMSFSKLNLQDALRLVTLNPALLIGMSEERGSLKPGSRADIVVLTPEGQLVQTLLGGEVV